MTLGLLFPGQGTQHPAMLPWLGPTGSQPAALRQMASVLGDDWRQRLPDAAWSVDNRVAQTLLTGISLAAWQVLAPLLPAPAAVAGYSVGELAAFSVAGVFSAEQAVALADQRAAIMAACVVGHATGLLSLSGTPAGWAASLCQRLGLALAIRLGEDRCIIGGPTVALGIAEQAAAAAGVHSSRLAVALASHTPWLAPGAPSLAEVLAAVPFARPNAVLVCNFSGTALRRERDLRQALAGQIARTVLWDSCMDTLAERGVRCVLEVGPGSSLSRLWQGRHPAIPARSADEFGSPQAVAAWVAAALAAG